MNQDFFTFFKIPFLEEIGLKQILKQKKEPTIIGIIDASGSMEPCWEWLVEFWNKSIPKQNLITITFSNYAHVLQGNNKLSPDILTYGGKGTEIIPAFTEFEKQLKKIPVENNVTVIFISDGQDNNVKTLDQRMKQNLKGNTLNHKINFICLGIENEFPTILSMNLRSLYHKGDPSIPAIYLIEYVSAQAFFNKFESMKQYFEPTRVLQLNKYVNLYPYDEQITKEVFEGQWCICNEGNLVIINEGHQIPVQGISESQITIEDSIDLFRGWVQNLQLKIISQKQHLPQQCDDCLQIMKRVVVQLNKQLGFDLLTISLQDIMNSNKSFQQRAKEGFVYKYCAKLIYFVNEIESLQKGVNPGQLNEFEQAKRLMIGTITGKHHQKALALKGITVDEFQIMKNEFITIVKNCEFKILNEQGQERSVITLENQRDILIDKNTLKESMQYIKSQYDFAETFPLIGHGIKVKRIEGSQVNPWLVSVLNFAQQNKVIDSGYLIKNNFSVLLNVGGEDKEEINCILPLYNESDIDLQPFLRSRIIKLLMTFMVQQNVDTLYEETYLALLANALVFLLSLKDSQWKQEVLDLIYTTTKIVYSGTQEFEEYLNLFVNDTNKALLLEKNQQYEDFIAQPKVIIYLFYAFKSGLLKDPEQYIEKLILYSFYRIYKREINLNTYAFKAQLTKQSEQKLQELLKLEFSKYLYVKQFRSELNKDFAKVFKKSFPQLEKKVVIHENVLYNENSKFNFKDIEGLYRIITGKEYDTTKYQYYLAHVLTEQDVFNKQVNFQSDAIIAEFAFKGDQMKKYDFIRDQLEQEYIKQFQELHLIIKPITYNELQSECEKLKVNINQIIFNKDIGIAKNCCMAKGCYFYLKPMEIDKFRKHLHNWQDLYPRGFHGFVESQINLNNEQLFQKCQEKWKNGFPQKYQGTQQQCYHYFDIIRNFVKEKQL